MFHQYPTLHSVRKGAHGSLSRFVYSPPHVVRWNNHTISSYSIVSCFLYASVRFILLSLVLFAVTRVCGSKRLIFTDSRYLRCQLYLAWRNSHRPLYGADFGMVSILKWVVLFVALHGCMAISTKGVTFSRRIVLWRWQQQCARVWSNYCHDCQK